MKSALRWLCIVVTFFLPPVAAEALPEGLVRETQFLLMQKGYNPGAIDGIYGEKTANAILSYERKYHLPLTGRPTYDLVSRLQYEPKEEELSGKIDNMQKELADIKQERAFLSKQLVKMRKDFQRGENFQAQKYDLINIGADIVTDIVSITLAAVGLGLLGTYALIKRMITARTKLMLQTGEKKLRYGLYVDLSNGFYNIYRLYLNRSINDTFVNCIQLAIHYANGAIHIATKLPNKDPAKKDMVMYAKFHKAYHQASAARLSPTDRASALLMAPQLKEAAEKLKREGEKRWVEYTDTLGWVLSKMRRARTARGGGQDYHGVAIARGYAPLPPKGPQKQLHSRRGTVFRRIEATCRQDVSL